MAKQKRPGTMADAIKKGKGRAGLVSLSRILTRGRSLRKLGADDETETNKGGFARVRKR